MDNKLTDRDLSYNEVITIFLTYRNGSLVFASVCETCGAL